MSHNKLYIDKLIDIYLDSLVSTSNDAGWAGDSLMSRLLESRGTARADQSNAAMINAIRFLKDEHSHLGMIRGIINRMLGTCGESNKILALLSKRHYVGLIKGEDRAYQDHDRLSLMNRAPTGPFDSVEDAQRKWETAERYYRRDIADAYRVLESEISKAEAA